jgi:hypothetical protein
MQRCGAEPLQAGSAPSGAATRSAAELGANDSPQGRPKVDQPPRGAATRAAAERGGSVLYIASRTNLPLSACTGRAFMG